MANNWDWGEIFKVAAGATLVIGGAYVSHRMIETQIDNLLQLPLESGLRSVSESVPQMDNETCLDFQRRLSARINSNSKADSLLTLTRLMVQAENQVRQIINQYSIRDAVDICGGILRQKNPAEQFAFVAFLNYLAKSDHRAQAVLGYLMN